MLKICIETRGKSLDYRFLIEAPSEYWWRDYYDLTLCEDPTFIIENVNGIRHIYLSDIPSKRKDRVQTIIRYAIVVEFDDKNDHLNKQALLNLVSIWLEEVGQDSKDKKNKIDTGKPKESKIGNLLDECFPEEDVEKLLRVKQPNSEDKENLKNRLKKFIDELSKLPNPEIKDEYTHARWYGGIENDRNRKIWIALVSELLKGGVDGQALFLNLATEDNLHKLVSKSKKIGLLINNDSKPNPLPSNNFNIGNIINSIGNSIKNSPLKSFGLGCVLVGLFIFSVSIIFPTNRLSESEVINFVVASCPAAIKATNPTPNSQKSEIQLTNLTAIPNSPNSENQTTNLTPTPNSPNSENQTTNSTAIPNSSNSENQTTNSNSTPNSSNSEIKSTNLTPTPNSPKPEIQVIKEELATAEELANKLGVNKDTLLSEMKKCHESFKKWSEQFGKGKWDFKINGSQIIFKKVIKN